MNNRLIALIGALQGGTRRKPEYLNLGALVSFLYNNRIKDKVSVNNELTELLLKDLIVIPNITPENISMLTGVSLLELQDLIKNLIVPKEDIFINTAISTLELKDVLVTPQTPLKPEITSMGNLLSVAELRDVLKSAGTNTDSVSVSTALTEVLLEPV